METECNNTQKISLKDLIDIPSYQQLCDSFTQLTGIGTAVIDLNGDVLIASGWQSICTEFHRKNPNTASRCLESDTVLAGGIARGKKYNIYRCKNGLVDVACPIIIEDVHVGNLFTGQFLFEPPNRDFFIQQAEEFGFDKDSYLDSLAKVPIFSMEEVKQAMAFLTKLTIIVGNTGFDKKKLFELNENLEQRIQERTADLKDSNERFRSLSEASFEGIIITENGKILEINDTFCKMLGYQPSELINKEALYIVSPETRESVQKIIMSGSEQPYESSCQRKDGSTFPVEVQAKMFLHKGRQVRVKALRDITVRKQAEDLLKEREQLYRALFENNSSVMLLIDPKTSVIYDANQSACLYYGYSKETLTHMKITDINVLSEKEVFEEMEKTKSENKNYFNFRHQLSDGTFRDVEVFSGSIMVGGNSLLCSIVHDISERKRIENQIKIERQFSESLINSLPGVMYVFNELGHFKRWNKNFESVTGYSPNQIKELTPLDLIAPEDKDSVKEAIETVFREGSVIVEAGFSTLRGQIIPYLFTGYKFEQKNINYLVGIGIDITNRIKTEKEKEKLINKLQETLVQVKQLSGFLPICAKCKKIRNDKGYWTRVEKYIEDNSDVKFSHGICESCEKELYGEQEWYKKAKKKQNRGSVHN